MKHHRGINQCHIASDKIIEVRSNGMEVRCNGMKVRSNGMEVRSNGMKVRSNGMKVRSNGMQVAIRLHFCPECPSIQMSLCHWKLRSSKVRQYTIFHWPLKKGCGNAIYAPIGLFRGARNEGLVFAGSCAVLNKCQLCGGKFCFYRRRKSFTVKENHFKNLRRLCKWYRRKLHVSCHSNKVLRTLIRGTQKLINSS